MGTTSQWFIQLARLSMLVIWLVGLSQFGNLARPASRTAGLGHLASWLIGIIPLASWAM
jgi:uncharacterized protein YhhL (DUF1145 family)